MYLKRNWKIFQNQKSYIDYSPTIIQFINIMNIKKLQIIKAEKYKISYICGELLQDKPTYLKNVKDTKWICAITSQGWIKLSHASVNEAKRVKLNTSTKEAAAVATTTSLSIESKEREEVVPSSIELSPSSIDESKEKKEVEEEVFSNNQKEMFKRRMSLFTPPHPLSGTFSSSSIQSNEKESTTNIKNEMEETAISTKDKMEEEEALSIESTTTTITTKDKPNDKLPIDSSIVIADLPANKNELYCNEVGIYTDDDEEELNDVI